MKSLSIKRELSEETRIQTVTLNSKREVFDLHHGLGDDSINYYITQHGKPDQIFMVVSAELWNIIFE